MPKPAAKHYTHNGKTQTLGKWSRETGIEPGTIRERLNRGWSLAEALTTPVTSGATTSEPEADVHPAEAAYEWHLLQAKLIRQQAIADGLKENLGILIPEELDWLRETGLSTVHPRNYSIIAAVQRLTQALTFRRDCRVAAAVAPKEVRRVQ